MRRAVAFGLLALGMVVTTGSASPAQPVAPPTTAATTAPTTTSTSTPTRPPATVARDRLPTLGEGFPWITVGAVILVAGLVGARLRRASRR